MVECLVCHQVFGQISEKHLMAKHHMTYTTYKRIHPSAKTLDESSLQKIIDNNLNPERCQKVSDGLKGRTITWGDKISEVKKEQYKDPVLAKLVVQNITRTASHISPNKPEQLVMHILDQNYPNEWKYVGNCGLVLGGKVPDFMNINGKKQLIEVFGDYWHRGQNPQERIDHFRQFGFSTLVIWEHEMKILEVVEEKIATFLSVETLHKPSVINEKNIDEDKVRYSSKEESNIN
jgi:hypothetical protein